MEFMISLKDILIEISPIFIALASLIALVQIVIAKRSIQTRSKRESVCLAAEKCDLVAKEILPLFQASFVDDPVNAIMKEWQLHDTDFIESSLANPKEGEAWVQQIIDRKHYVKSIDFLNRLEGLSMYFANGVADEDIAYPVIGSLFCMWINNFAPLLIRLRGNQVPKTTSGPYQNTVKLYEVWMGRQGFRQLQKEAKDISMRMSSANDAKIKPIGV